MERCRSVQLIPSCRDLNAVADDRRAPVVRRRRPVEFDARRQGGGRHEVRGRIRGDRVGGGVGHVRRCAYPDLVDRRDAVVARAGRSETRVRVGGCRRSGVSNQVRPRRPLVLRHLDPVAGDLGTAVEVRDIPVEVDLLMVVGGRRQPSGSVRHGRVGGGFRTVGRIARSDPVDRRDAVVPGARGRQPHVGVCRVRVVRVCDQIVPDQPSVDGDLDAVAGDRGATVVGRGGPGEVDLRGAVGLGHEVRRGIRRRRVGGGVVDIRRLAHQVGGVDRGDAVVAGCGGIEALVSVPGCRRVGVGFQDLPLRPAVRGDFDLVSGERDAAVVGRRGPIELDPRGSVSLGH